MDIFVGFIMAKTPDVFHFSTSEWNVLFNLLKFRNRAVLPKKCGMSQAGINSAFQRMLTKTGRATVLQLAIEVIYGDVVIIYDTETGCKQFDGLDPRKKQSSKPANIEEKHIGNTIHYQQGE